MDYGQYGLSEMDAYELLSKTAEIYLAEMCGSQLRRNCKEQEAVFAGRRKAEVGLRSALWSTGDICGLYQNFLNHSRGIDPD